MFICFLHCLDFLFSSLFWNLFIVWEAFLKCLVICGLSSYLIVRPKKLMGAYVSAASFWLLGGTLLLCWGSLIRTSGCLPWHMLVSPERNLLVSCLGNKCLSLIQRGGERLELSGLRMKMFISFLLHFQHSALVWLVSLNLEMFFWFRVCVWGVLFVGFADENLLWWGHLGSS